MALWTDIITPAELTGYIREDLSAVEQRRGSLARFLPNRVVPDIVVRFIAGQAGLVPEAEFHLVHAGHAATEPAIVDRLVRATDALADRA